MVLRTVMELSWAQSTASDSLNPCYNMGVFGPPFFMKKILTSPVTHFNLLVVGSLGIIQGIHLQAHYAMDSDPNSYCYSLYKKNPDLLNRHKYD